MSIAFQVTFDAADPRALGQFWALALEYQQEDPPEGFESWEAAMTAWGLPEDRWGDAYAIIDREGAGPRLYFQKVPEPKTAKNRVHLDVNVGGHGTPAAERVTTCREHATRLAEAGAQVVREVGDSSSEEFWIVMSDPEGNEFCLQ